ncbi:hypothetical protein P8452_20674 [Trifolium repens]|nr:hypothetical protein P8452_20674 [Trifolium repens]
MTLSGKSLSPQCVELYAEKVNNRGLCAISQAESLRYKLLGGLALRRLKSLVVDGTSHHIIYGISFISELMQYVS